MNIACDFALAFRFIEQMKMKQGKFKMTQLGIKYSEFLLEDKSLLRHEKKILEGIGRKFSERVINDIRMGVQVFVATSEKRDFLKNFMSKYQDRRINSLFIEEKLLIPTIRQ